jgi:multimeric flavodoxin WrbA
MRQLYPLIDSSDVIVFGTPVYWFGPTGPMKQFIDRLRPYYASRGLQGKKAILVSPANDGPKEADLLVEMLRRSFMHLGVRFAGSVLGTAYDRGDILKDEAAVEEAARIGRSLGMK